MMKMVYIGVVVLIIGISLGYLVMRPLKIKDVSWKLRFTFATYRVMLGIIDIAESLGFGPFYETFKKFITPLVRKAVKESPDVKMATRDFDGVRSLVYHPAADPSGLRPALVWFHGGGWVLGAPEMLHSFFQKLVRRLDLVIVAVDYSKAPEHAFPRGYEDSRRALLAFLSESRLLGVDKDRIALGGESAGGNLAAAVAGHLPASSISHLLLVYPVLQALDFQLPSYLDNADGEMLSRDLMLRFWQLYLLGRESFLSHLKANQHRTTQMRADARRLLWEFLPGRPSPKEEEAEREAVEALSSRASDPRASPSLLSDATMSALPPVYMVTCQHDPLRDEGMAFVGRLRSLKRQVRLHNYDAYHGLLSLADANVPEAVRMVEEMVEYLRSEL